MANIATTKENGRQSREGGKLGTWLKGGSTSSSDGGDLSDLKSSSVDSEGTPAPPNSASLTGSHGGGTMNPLAWENLPPSVKDTLEGVQRLVKESTHIPDPEDELMAPPSANASVTRNPPADTSKRRSRHFTQPKGTTDYTVSNRDTLASIAAQFQTTTSELKKLNKLMGASMVFPGQTLFVPDPDYESSESPSPVNSPHHKTFTSSSLDNAMAPPDIPTVRQVIKPPHPAPGLAERTVPAETEKPPDVVPKALSEEEAKRLDEECFERFIKVNVKHITDGQGVVNGVLLVTPNAIMFDPNVTDALVMENSPEKYGMIAPMETIISAAMYHDIKAMKYKQGVSNGDKPAIYHSESCPMYTETSGDDVKGKPEAMDQTDKPGTTDADGGTDGPPHTQRLSRMHRENSVCSCGAFDLMTPEDPPGDLKEEDEEEENRVEAAGEAAGQADTTSRNTGLSGGSAASEDLAQLYLHAQSGEQAAGSDHTEGVMGGTEADVSTVEEGESPRDDNEGEIPQDSKEGESPRAAEENESQRGGKEGESPQDHKVGESPAAGDDDDAATPHTQIGNIKYFQYDDIPLPTEDVADGKPDGEERSPGLTSLTSESGSPRGVLGRTIDSLSSLGSGIVSTSPNFSTIVDFSSGLFTRNAEDRGRVRDINDLTTNGRVRDINDLTANTTTVWHHGQPSASIVQQDPAGRSQGARPDLIDGAGADPGADSDLVVENMVKLVDRPDLFKSLDELIPRPATYYEDPPLYLCLKVGTPINKAVSRTCPIESYRNTCKPEYWFSIPRDKVDQLYAFFVQWSPNIYGDEEDIDPGERGFVVIQEGDQADMSLVENHFQQDQRQAGRGNLKRQMTKDWEIVTIEEARRRISVVDPEDMLALPELCDPSCILTEEHQIRKVAMSLPARAEGYSWALIYSCEKNGFSLKTLYRCMQSKDTPILLLLRDTRQQVFGAFLSCPPRLSEHFYGTGLSYLFSFYPEYFRKYSWTGTNSFFIKGNAESLAIGSGDGSFGLWLDGDLYHGRTQPCQTFNNELLTETEDFMVDKLEAWGFV